MVLSAGGVRVAAPAAAGALAVQLAPVAAKAKLEGGALPRMDDSSHLPSFVLLVFALPFEQEKNFDYA